MREVIEKETQGHSHHQRWSEPAIEDEREELELCRSKHDHQKYTALKSPLHQLPAFPQPALEEKPFVVEESWRD